MTITGALCLVVALGRFAFGERVSFDSRSAWQEWTYPVDAVDLQATGRIQPMPVRKTQARSKRFCLFVRRHGVVRVICRRNSRHKQKQG